MALFENITTEEQMVDYIKVKCGMPILNLEVTDDQIKQAIWDSIEDFRRYNYSEGSFMDYAIFTTSANVSEYSLSAITDMNGNPVENVQDIYDFGLTMTMDGINTLFSPTHILLQDQFVTGRSGGCTKSNTGLNLTSYQIAMQYLEDIKAMFGKWYTISLIHGRQKIQVVPTPTGPATGMLQFYRKEYATYLYNNVLVKKLAVARTMMHWGRHLSKYQTTLPDGMSINGDAFYNEGKEDSEKILEDMRLESRPPDFFVA